MRPDTQRPARRIHVLLLFIASLFLGDVASAQSTLDVDVAMVNPTGTYGEGSQLRFEMKIPSRLGIAAPPRRLTLRMGGATRSANYIGRTSASPGFHTLSFAYTVVAGDSGSVTIPAQRQAASIQIFGGGNRGILREWDAVQVRTSVQTSGSIDTTAPSITGVVVKADGRTSGRACGPVTFEVTFNEEIRIAPGQATSFPFRIGPAQRQAGTPLRAPPRKLTFTFRPTNEGGVIAYALPSGQPFARAVTDSAGNPVKMSQSLSAITALEIDCERPRILGIVASVNDATTTSGTFGPTNRLLFTITFSEPVEPYSAAATAPTFNFTVGAGAQSVSVAAGLRARQAANAPSNVLVFEQVIPQGTGDLPAFGADGIVGWSAQDGLALRDTVGNLVDGTTAPRTSSIIVDTVGPRLLNCAARIDGLSTGLYGPGKELILDFEFDEPANLAPGSRVTFDIGGQTRQATPLAGSSTTRLSYRHVTAANDNGVVALGSRCPLPTAVKDAAGNEARSSPPPAPSPSSLTIDTRPPRITAIAVDVVGRAGDPGPFGVGRTIEFKVDFDEDVRFACSDPPRIPFFFLLNSTISAPMSAYAACPPSSGASSPAARTIAFRHLVARGDNGVVVHTVHATPTANTTPFQQPIRDLVGNDLSVPASLSAASTWSIDTEPPTVSGAFLFTPLSPTSMRVQVPQAVDAQTPSQDLRYRLYFPPAPNSPAAVSASSLSHTITNLTSGVGYLYRMEVEDHAGNIAYFPTGTGPGTDNSAAVSASTPSLPGVPGSFVGADGPSVIRLQWAAATDTDRYELQRTGPLHRPAIHQSTVSISVAAPGHSGTVVHLDPPTDDGRYRYTLSAINAWGRTASSVVVVALKDSTAPAISPNVAPLVDHALTCVDPDCSNVGVRSFPYYVGSGVPWATFNSGGIAALQDGSDSTGVATNSATLSPYPEVTFDLGAVLPVDEIKIGSMKLLYTGLAPTAGYEFLDGILGLSDLNGKRLDHSTNGQNFATVGTVADLYPSGHGGVTPQYWRAALSNPFATRYLRIRSMDGSGIGISEFRVSVRAFAVGQQGTTVSAIATEDPYSSITAYGWQVIDAPIGPSGVAGQLELVNDTTPNPTIRRTPTTISGLYRLRVTVTNIVGSSSTAEYTLRVP